MVAGEIRGEMSMGSLDKYSNKPSNDISTSDIGNALDERLRKLEAERDAKEKELKLREENERMNALLEKRRLDEDYSGMRQRREHINEYPDERERSHIRFSKTSNRQDRRKERREKIERRRLKRKGIEYDDYDEPTDDVEVDKYSEKIIMDKYMQRHKGMKKGERRLIEGKEYEGNHQRQNGILYLAILGLFFIMFLYFYVKIEWMSMILLYVGLMMFMPIGMIVGWVFLDPYMRCKTLRRMTHKNYGIVNFVGKGNKLVSKIKNFDDALIWRGNSVWAITKEHIYQLSKNGDYIATTGKIDSESVVTLVETVPVIFCDLDSMQPMSLARDRREGINPLELGPALKSWVDNEKAKAIGLRKTMDMFFIILIILSVVSMGLAYMSMSNVTDLSDMVTKLSGKIDTIIQQLNQTGILP